MKYLLDANVFIQAHRFYYPMDVFPIFWEWLKKENDNGLLFSLDLVYDELKIGEDILAEWCNKLDRASWFLSSEDEATQNSMSDIANWTIRQDKFKDTAKSEFLSVADPWIIAKAKTDNMTVVTQEKSKPESKSKIFIPDVCIAFDVNYINTVEMLRTLGGKF